MSRPALKLVVGAAMVTGKHPTARVREVMVEDILYRCNGWDQPWWLDETNSAEYPMGSEVPKVANVTIADAGSGTGFAALAVVDFRVTYYNSSLPNGGKETAPYEYQHTVGGSPSDIDITITDPATIQAQFDSARVYRKLPGGTYKLHTTKTGSWATPVTDANESLLTANQQVRRYRETLPPIFSWMDFHDGHLWGCTGKDAILYFAQLRRVSGEGNLTCDYPSGNISPINVNDGAGHVVAVVSEWEQLIVFKENAIYRLVGESPNSMVLRVIARGVGCIAAHSIVAVHGVLFFLDERGLMMLTREGQPVLVAALEGTNGSPLKSVWEEINRNAVSTIFATHNRYEGTIELSIPYGDEPTPDKCVIYDYRSGFDRFVSIDDRWFTRAADVLDGGGVRHPMAIDDLGTLWEYDLGDIEGAQVTGTYNAIIDTGTVSAVELTTTALGTLYRGALLRLRDAAGVLKWTNRIATATGTSITLLYAESDDLAVSTDLVYWGVIPATARSGDHDYEDPRFQKMVKSIAVMHRVESGGTLTVAFGEDGGTPSTLELIAIDLSVAEGFTYVSAEGVQAHRVSWELSNEAAAEPWSVSSIDIEAASMVEGE